MKKIVLIIGLIFLFFSFAQTAIAVIEEDITEDYRPRGAITAKEQMETSDAIKFLASERALYLRKMGKYLATPVWNELPDELKTEHQKIMDKLEAVRRIKEAKGTIMIKRLNQLTKRMKEFRHKLDEFISNY